MLQVEPIEEPRGFRLVGEVDVSNADELEEAILPAVEEGGDLTLDLSELAFIDSSGVQVLIRSAQTLDGRGRMILRSPARTVSRVLELLQLERLPNLDIEEGEAS